MTPNIENFGTELYINQYGGVYQCDKTNRVHVHFAGSVTRFRIDNFLNFKKLVDEVDIHTMIFDLSDEHDYEVIDLPNASRKIKLTICEIIHLRDLLDGAKFALYVHDFVSEILYEPAL